MTHQTSFQFTPETNAFKLPTSRPGIDERCEPEGAKFFAAHPWFIPWIISYLRDSRRAGNRSGSLRACFEVARHQFPKELGEEIPGIGKVGLNNNYQHSVRLRVLKVAPDLKGFIRVRTR